ncbi:hypothetical protein [Mycolicibacterium sp. S2-37]|nr:hypothetical protein [Mycolicibacterium sp. S2-37]
MTLTHDWSAVSAEFRDHIAFPPFGRDHLQKSLRNLATLAQLGRSGPPAR